MKRNYDDLCYQYGFKQDAAFEKDLMDDSPDFELTQLIRYIIFHSYDHKGEQIMPGDGCEIEQMYEVSDEKVEWFCDKYAEYENWAVVYLNYFRCNQLPDPDVWSLVYETARDICSIFEYYGTKSAPRLLMKRGVLQRVTAKAVATTSSPKPQNTFKTLPAELQTEKALIYWTKAQTCNPPLVNKDYSFNGSIYKRAYFAKEFSKKLGLKYCWKPFQQLWDYKRFAQDYRQAEQYGYINFDFVDQIKEIFKD